ncbi:MAG: DNA recombination protein RmuC [Gammaproteobacteria bacterium]|nr:DNA recombination protein RmuC [Gammaproteobacteria bacterium]
MDELQSFLAAVRSHQPLIVASLLGLLVVLVLRLLVNLAGLRARLREDLGDQRALLREVREDIGDDVAQSRQQVQESLTAGLMRLQDLLDQRMNALQRQMLQDAAMLKTDLIERFEAQRTAIGDTLAEGRLAQQRESAELRAALEAALNRHREATERHQREVLRGQQETLTSGMRAMAEQVSTAFRTSSDELGKRVEGLTRTTDDRLKDISGQVERRLSEGFEKTTETFARVLEHLGRIDEAQKRITELSTNVVSLQEVLTDKRSRGAFGEVQLNGLVRNVMPEGSFSLQHTLSNGTRVDCLLRLPDPTGNVPVDAKFPLESFQAMMDNALPETDRARAARQFRQDIRRHVRDIAEKYLVPGETADGAVMFLPAEAIFAEIHAHFPDLVEEAQRARVWLVSPTTLMAVLTTARAVLKDEATRKQVHIIQDHLRRLSEDFGRFQDRMDKLALHIRQANDDVRQVNTSARKISARFRDIDQVEIPETEADADAEQGLAGGAPAAVLTGPESRP